MKLAPRTFQTFWDVHAWSGVVVGLLLHFIFFAGAFALFREPLEIWQEPFVQRPTPLLLETHVDAILEKAFGTMAMKPKQFRVSIPSGANGLPKVCYSHPVSEVWSCVAADPLRGETVAEREHVANFLFNLHYLWFESAPWVYYVSGFAAVALLLALVTGLLIHVKDLGRNFYQFRPKKGQRVLWSDMHKVLGVMGLPFQIMVAFTGAVLVLSPWIVDVFTRPVFAGSRSVAEHLAWGSSAAPAEETGPPREGLPVTTILSRAHVALPTFTIEQIAFTHWGYENALVEVRGRERDPFNGQAFVRLRARDGAVLDSTSRASRGASDAVRRWSWGLHFARYGGLWLRLLYALLAFATCLTVLTGNWIWLARREARRASLGNRLLARLTVGVGAGVCLATAAVLAASRVLPLDLWARSSWESGIFFASLAAAVGWALAARDGTTVWWQALSLAGGLFVLTPIVAARWSSRGLFGAGAARIFEVVAVDAGLTTLGLALFAVAWFVRRTSSRRAEEEEKSVPRAVIAAALEPIARESHRA